MSREFSTSVHFSPELQRKLDQVTRRVGVSRDDIIEYAVRELLKDLNYPELEESDRHAMLKALMEDADAAGQGAPAQGSAQPDE